MSRFRHPGFFLILTAALVLLGLFLLRQGMALEGADLLSGSIPSCTAVEESLPKAGGPASRSADGSLPGRRALGGEARVRVYRLRLDRSHRLSLTGGGGRVRHLSMDGEVRLEWLGDAGGSEGVRLILLPERIHLAGEKGRKPRAGEMEVLRRSLARPLRIRLAGDGSWSFPVEAGEQAGPTSGLLRHLAAAVLIQHPAGRSGGWQAVETDGRGRYRANYWPGTIPAAGGTVHRRKECYLDSATGGGCRVDRMEGSACARFDRPGRIVERIALREKVWASAGEGRVRTLETLTILLSHGRDPVGFREAGALLAWEGGELLHRLGQLLLAEDPNSPRVWALGEELTHLVRDCPAELAVLGRALRRPGLAAGTLEAALAAIARADTDRVRDFLLRFTMDGDLDPGRRQAAAMAMFQLGGLGERGRSLLGTILANTHTGRADGPLRRSLLMALLGLPAGECQEGEAPTLATLETPAQQKGILAAWLACLGRTGSPQALSAATRYLDHRDRQVRLAALEALGRLPGPEAGKRLLARFGAAGEFPAERAAAARIVARRFTDRELAGVAERVLQDPAPAVRLGVIEGLSRRQGFSRAAFALLRKLADQDPDEDVREFARHRLDEL